MLKRTSTLVAINDEKVIPKNALIHNKCITKGYTFIYVYICHMLKF